MDGIVVDRGVGQGVPQFADYYPVAAEFASLLYLAEGERGEYKTSLIETAIDVFDTAVLPAVTGLLDEHALHLIDFTGIDALELVSCLGPSSVAEVLAWAVNTVRGVYQEPPEPVAEYASCLGIDEVLVEVGGTGLASAIIYATVASVNRLAVRIASEGL